VVVVEEFVDVVEVVDVVLEVVVPAAVVGVEVA